MNGLFGKSPATKSYGINGRESTVKMADEGTGDPDLSDVCSLTGSAGVTENESTGQVASRPESELGSMSSPRGLISNVPEDLATGEFIESQGLNSPPPEPLNSTQLQFNDVVVPHAEQILTLGEFRDPPPTQEPEHVPDLIRDGILGIDPVPPPHPDPEAEAQASNQDPVTSPRIIRGELPIPDSPAPPEDVLPPESQTVPEYLSPGDDNLSPSPRIGTDDGVIPSAVIPVSNGEISISDAEKSIIENPNSPSEAVITEPQNSTSESNTWNPPTSIPDSGVAIPESPALSSESIVPNNEPGDSESGFTIPETPARSSESPARSSESIVVPESSVPDPDSTIQNDDNVIHPGISPTHSDDDNGNTEQGLLVDDEAPIVPIFKVSRDRPTYSDSELDRVLENFIRMRGRSFSKIPPDMYRPLFQHISRLRVEAIEFQTYARGESLMEAYALLKRSINEDLTAADIAFEKQINTARLNSARQLLAETQHHCQNRVNKLEDNLMGQRMDLEARHDREIARFQEEWADPTTLTEFHKPSGQLLQFRQIEQKMAVIGDFRGARLMKQVVDKQEKLETTTAQQRAKVGMKAAYDRLIMHQQKEITGLRTLEQRIKLQLEAQNDAELLPIIMAIKKLESRCEQPKSPRRAPKVSKSLLVRRKSPGEAVGDPPLVATPRTSQRLMTVRATPRTAMLSLKPVETKQLIRATVAKEKPPKKRASLNF
jgi:hypothetical protein